MKKLLLTITTLLTLCSLASCSEDSTKVIKVCASEIPHAEVLKGCVKQLVEKQGYKLKIKVLDWTLQNDAVANGDYDANYFQHVPYLNKYTLNGVNPLAAAVKVHYEPLGIYHGKSTGNLEDGKTFEICNDTSNAIRALELLKAKGVFTTIPVSEDGQSLIFEGNSWTSEGKKVTLISEELLVASLKDYDFACLPCNTALTGKISNSTQVAKEDDPDQVSLKANIIAVRKENYLNDAIYKTKIDVLCDAMLSSEVSSFFERQYSGLMTCDSSSQIDLRSDIQ